MAQVQWIKIVTDVFDDEKIRLIETLPEGDTVIVIWFKLLTLAAKCNNDGVIFVTRDIPYNEEMLSTILRRPVNTIRLALDNFIKLGMIEILDGFINVINWKKHQNTDYMDKIREQNRVRQQKRRAIANDSHVTVTLRHDREEKRIEENREEKKKKVIEPDEPSPCQQSFKDIRALFESKNSTYYHDGKQAKCIKGIMLRCEKTGQSPVDVIERYHSLTTGTDKWWAQQPFTPCGLLGLWDRVMVTEQKKEKYEYF